LVSIIFVNWNCIKDITETISQIETFPPKVEYEYIVIDNGSDDFLDWINEYKHDIRYFRLEENLGYGCAANIGIILSRGKYVALLNPDLKFNEGWLDILVDYLEVNLDVGLVAPASNNSCNYNQNLAVSTKEIYVEKTVIPFICVVISKKIFSDVGFINHKYAEDVDFCIRVNNAGFKCVIVGNALVEHFLSMSFVRNNVGKDWTTQVKYVKEIVEPRFLGR
jgi:GT2 family glycosyltransferase